MKKKKTRADLELRFLGPMEVWRDGERINLPRSKKTRALLAYLAATGREHSRERLCTLLWDVTDDPRGALRWSLSKLRQVVNDDLERIVADRERVSFVAQGASIDVVELTAAVSSGLQTLDVETLEKVASSVRGEFLEGFELPDFFDFQAWCIAERERAREARAALFTELVGRLRDEPRRALPFARLRAEVDSFSVPARIELLELLVEGGKRDEAQQQLEITRRLFKEVEAPGVEELDAAWRRLSTSTSQAEPPRESPPAPLPEPDESPLVSSSFVGRKKEFDRVRALAQEMRTTGGLRVALISGEPGAGKSRLAAELVSCARQEGLEVLQGRAYEAESSRPFGPWVDALRTEVSQLVSERGEAAPNSREELFTAVAEATAAKTRGAGAAMLVLDDVQWLDRDSSELLHFVARSSLDQPLFILLLARTGELSDNEPALRALRSLRRETQVEEVALGPLSREEIEELVAPYPNRRGDRIYATSTGNPLYALELARAPADEGAEAPSTVVQLVRERIDRLPSPAVDVLRWGAVMGHGFEVRRLESLSSLEPEELITALEQLERHALLRIDEGSSEGRYLFAHDLVREAVYGELSHPRRRLMHQRVAKLLEPDTSDSKTATEVAHHARQAGDAMLGVHACLVAGRHSLRVFANGDAEALALRGLDLAESLDDVERIRATLELLHVRYSARTPDRDEAANRVRPLAERALELGLTKAARLGFQMLSFLRWESSSMAAAHDNIMQAERLSRSGDPRERTAALSQAAKCLVLLERNLEQAEAFVLEADLLASRGGMPTSAVTFAAGMIHEHRGEFEQARESFVEAQRLAQEQGDRLAEFCAIEHAVMLEIDQGQHTAARTLATPLLELGQRVRPGAERHSGRGLLALSRLLCGEEEAASELEPAIEDLRQVDAKYQLTFLLTRRALREVEKGNHEAAQALAADALSCATAIGRASDIAISRALLVRCAGTLGGDATEHSKALGGLNERELSAGARRIVAELRGGVEMSAEI